MAAPNLVGLDIGSSSIRAAETSRGKEGPTITGFGHVALPAGAVQAGVVQDDRAVTQAIKELWSTAKIRNRRVLLGVNNPQVVVREMTVQNLPMAQLRASLPFQVRDALPLAVERSVLDFYPLEDAGHNETVRGLLVAAPKDAVLAAVRATERAGLHVARVDLASFALVRSVSQLDVPAEALVDLGARSTIVVVHAGGVPVIVRTIPRGGAEITEAVAARRDVTQTEAEALKCRTGLIDTEDPDTADAVREAVRPIISEIRSSFAYLTAGDRQTRVSRLVLSGGGALLPGLVDALATQLGVETVLAEPTIRVREARGTKTARLDRMRSAATVSIGLALGAAA